MTLATTLAGVASPDQMKRDARKSGGLSALLWPNACVRRLDVVASKLEFPQPKRNEAGWAHRPASVMAEVLSRMAYSCRTR